MASDDRYMQFFRETDKDGSGTLTVQELITMLKSKGYAGSDTKIRQMFDQIDTSGDGVLTLNEYLIGMGQIPPEDHKGATMRSVFRQFDKNRDGCIDKSELGEVFKEMGNYLSPAEIDRMMKLCDTDGSGTLNYEEFITKVFGKKV
ncbi:hypothetical protein HELRODRAFT_175454 [Helobdella robusta]|uniref:EF-hand domain-containing protein n=1 Tax=Helobdella robusta TaxID=6412 RepID=T1F998_HELRO|nr:hypothetical protein HELRODRAFT_175454 [Helobdella robusta]ESO00951.1 hypothetical protein HELRODRAFT_175454 [Helobdella robusta]